MNRARFSFGSRSITLVLAALLAVLLAACREFANPVDPLSDGYIGGEADGADPGGDDPGGGDPGGNDPGGGDADPGVTDPDGGDPGGGDPGGNDPSGGDADPGGGGDSGPGGGDPGGAPPGGTTVPSNPSLTYILSDDDSSIDLFWPPVVGATGYRALRYPNDLEATPVELTVLFLAAENRYTVDENDLPDGTYFYRVFATNDAGESGPAVVGPIEID